MENHFSGLKSHLYEKLKSQISPVRMNLFQKTFFFWKVWFNVDILWNNFFLGETKWRLSLSLPKKCPGKFVNFEAGCACQFLTDFDEWGCFGKLETYSIEPCPAEYIQISGSQDISQDTHNWSSEGVTETFFEKISRNMIVTEKMLKTIIIGNFIADNIVLGREQLAHHPEEPPLEIWEFTNFHQVFSTFFWIWSIKKVSGGWFLKLDASLMGPPLLSSRT